MAEVTDVEKNLSKQTEDIDEMIKLFGQLTEVDRVYIRGMIDGFQIKNAIVAKMA